MVEPISISITAGSLIKGILKAVDKAKRTIDSFNTECDNLKKNLEYLTPRIESVIGFDEEIADLSMNDGLTVQSRTDMTNLVKQLEYCQQLVEKCTHLPLSEYHKFNFYTKELKACNKSLDDFKWMMMADVWVDGMKNRRVNYECSVPQPPEFIVGWTEPVGELKQKLLQEELPVIGICGAVGYGKSTLAKKLCAQVKGKFERISYITIPRSPDSPTEKKEAEKLNLIAIFDKLWDDLVRVSKPVFESAGGALEQLKQCLNKRKTQGKGMLVVLDGVWSNNMLQGLLIGTPGLKTLVTSRVELNGVNWSYRVQQLTMKDAMGLFRHHALLQAPCSEQKELAEQIVKGCKFHPLALKLTGASLMKAELSKWRTTAKNLQGTGTIFKNLKEIFWPLKTSLDSLEEPVERECFMDMSSFPDNKRIRAAALMDMWVHTRGQDERGAYDILKKLADRHLIELFTRTRDETVDLDERCNDLFIVQDDLLSELAVHVSKEEKSNTRLIINKGETFLDLLSGKHVISQAQIVSIHAGENINFEWADVPIPNVEVLILNFSSSSYCLPPFLKCMENLKVLIIANHNIATTVLSGQLPSGSLKSLRAVRLEKISLPISCTSMEPFNGVQKLSMILCKVDEVLEICSGFDIQTMFPDLIELEIGYCNGLERLPAAVCNMVNLLKLSITNCHDLSELPDEIHKLRKLQVLRLSACTSLERLPDSFSELSKLKFLDLFCCSRLESLPNSMNMLQSLEKIDFRGCFAKLPHTVINLEGLDCVICHEDAKIQWENVKTKSGRPIVHGCKDLVSLKFLE